MSHLYGQTMQRGLTRMWAKICMRNGHVRPLRRRHDSTLIRHNSMFHHRHQKCFDQMPSKSERSRKTASRASCEHSLASTPIPGDRPPFQQNEFTKAIPSPATRAEYSDSGGVNLVLRTLQLPVRSCPSLLRWLQACSRPFDICEDRVC